MKAHKLAFLALLFLLFIQPVLAANETKIEQNTSYWQINGSTIDVITDGGNSTMTTFVNGSYSIVTGYTDQIGGDFINTTKSFMREQFGIFNESEYPIQRIEQGECVQIGRTYDIGGLGWWTGKLAYYGPYVDDFAPTNSTDVVATKDIPSSKEGLSHFFIDPAFFRDKQGQWYVLYSKDERAANNRIFYVSSNCSLIGKRTGVIIKQNETPQTEAEKNVTLKGNWSLTPKLGDGIVSARGDPIHFYNTANNTTDARVWLFGRYGGNYDFKYTGGFVANSSVLESAPEGKYTFATISSGKNEIYEEQYDKETDTIVSPFVGKPHVNLTGMPSQSALQALKSYVNSTIDDTISTYDIDFQDAKIYITQLDQHQYSKDVEYLDITGYTNCANGTKISFDIDVYQTNSKGPVNTTAYTNAVSINNNPFEWRQFHVIIPVYLSSTTKGDHFIMAKTDTGARATAPFYIREELEANYVDPGTIRWVDNSPYIKPEIITKEVVKEVPVIQERIEYVKEPVDYDKLARTEISQLLPIVTTSLAALLLIPYFLSVAIRTNERRRQRFVSPYDNINSIEDLYED